MNWKFIAEAADGHGIGPEHLAGFGGAPNFAIDADQVLEIGPKPVEVRHAATGAMLIDVEVLKALAKMHPERRYKPNCNAGTHVPISLEWNFDFFRVGVRKEFICRKIFRLAKTHWNWDLKPISCRAPGRFTRERWPMKWT